MKGNSRAPNTLISLVVGAILVAGLGTGFWAVMQATSTRRKQELRQEVDRQVDKLTDEIKRSTDRANERFKTFPPQN
ncbi:MAG: hypothetical protein ACK4QL_05430 [Pseudanabaenaceae cyanobacterium]